jgi:putative transposase
MIDRKHELSIKRQAELVSISRGQVYYLARATSQADQELMRRIDAIHLEHPFAGSRMLRDLLGREGLQVGRRHVATSMRLMGIEALYRKPNTSKKHPGHTVYPYLLRGMKIERANHVWATDITYIPMACGWVYLCAIVDWASRRVLAHRVSISMDTTFCLEALEEAFAKHGQPEIFNTDQGSQFTSEAFTGALKKREIQISMDGRGSWRDNVFVERLWRSIKYEEVYLHAYESVSHAKAGIARYIDFYNSRRPHSSLDKQTPDEFYFATLPAMAIAA